jgi:hypothetical protein
MGTIRRAAWSLAAALEMARAAHVMRPDWVLDLWRLAYTKGDWDGKEQAQGLGSRAATAQAAESRLLGSNSPHTGSLQSDIRTGTDGRVAEARGAETSDKTLAGGR